MFSDSLLSFIKKFFTQNYGIVIKPTEEVPNATVEVVLDRKIKDGLSFITVSVIGSLAPRISMKYCDSVSEFFLKIFNARSFKIISKLEEGETETTKTFSLTRTNLVGGNVRISWNSMGVTGLTNAEKLAMPIDSPVGTQVRITDSFIMGGDAINGLWIPTGTSNGKPVYSSVTPSDSSLYWDTIRWVLDAGVEGGLIEAIAGAEEFPWLASWSSITLQENPIQELQSQPPSVEANWLTI